VTSLDPLPANPIYFLEVARFDSCRSQFALKQNFFFDGWACVKEWDALIEWGCRFPRTRRQPGRWAFRQWYGVVVVRTIAPTLSERVTQVRPSEKKLLEIIAYLSSIINVDVHPN
jgi:hypothetical protein